MKVHRALGPGFLEAVYEEALAKEFTNSQIPFHKQVKLDIFYEDQKLKKYYIADFICYDEIILEIKTVKFVPVAFQAQLRNYLTATKKRTGDSHQFWRSFIDI